VEGICDNVLPKGTHTIRIFVGRCIDSFIQPTKIVTGGFNFSSRLHIEEVRRGLVVDGGDNLLFSKHSQTVYRYNCEILVRTGKRLEFIHISFLNVVQLVLHGRLNLSED